MKKVLFFLGLLFIFTSCTLDPLQESVCQDGSCDAAFTIDTQVNPGSYQDANGVWHIKYSGHKYFTVKGIADKLNSENVVNEVPLIETGFDSDLFFTPTNIQWTYPVYSFLGLCTSSTLSQAIPYGYQTLTLPQILNNTSVTNMVGYEMNSHTTFDKPYSPTLLSVYSKYNYTPQRSMIFLPSFVGKEAKIYIRVRWGETHKEIQYYILHVKFEN
jgi:hypothetical protein